MTVTTIAGTEVRGVFRQRVAAKIGGVGVARLA